MRPTMTACALLLAMATSGVAATARAEQLSDADVQRRTHFLQERLDLRALCRELSVRSGS